MLQLVDVVDRIPADCWDKHGLGEWNVLELVAHVMRAVEGPVVHSRQAKPVDMEDAATYYLRAMAAPDIHAQVAKRARRSTAKLGDDPAAAARAIAERALAAIEQLEDDAPMSTPIGTVRLIDYLPTRVLEVVVHTMDVANAVGVEVEPPAAAQHVSLALLGEIAVVQGEGTMLTMALYGRHPLPDGYNVLA
ncbi:MAG: maleylpyruvate isomerase N-terminal domain-containing protein [Chloroflexota bacterium]|nr:maleylpyruvate isomerase N-terminal domain-containing protein [Chloroflexota bacterium]MDE2969424.1 maleylpyruvate isomerase N-terminal domain-containing protein [Chloroflexota bacterium]